MCGSPSVARVALCARGRGVRISTADLWDRDTPTQFRRAWVLSFTVVRTVLIHRASLRSGIIGTDGNIYLTVNGAERQLVELCPALAVAPRSVGAVGSDPSVHHFPVWI